MRREEKWDIWSPSFNACSFFDPCSASSHSAAVQLQSVSRGLFSTLFNHCLIFLQHPNILSHLEDRNYIIQGLIWRENSNILGLKRHCSLAPRVTTQPQVLSWMHFSSFLGMDARSFHQTQKYATMATIQEEKEDESKTWTLFY